MIWSGSTARLATSASNAMKPAITLQAALVQREQFMRQSDAVIEPLKLHVRGLEQAIAEARGCHQKLIAGYRGPLRDELKQIEAKRAEIHGRIGPIENTLDHHQNFLQSDMHPVSEHERGGHERIVKQCEEQLNELRSQLPPLAKREAEIEIEMAKP